MGAHIGGMTNGSVERPPGESEGSLDPVEGVHTIGRSRRTPAGRLLLAGVAGGLAMNVSMLLTFRVLGFGWAGGGVLLDPSVQSPKLIAVWTELHPLPKVYADPVPIVLGLLGFGILHAVVYRSIAPAWPSGLLPRASRFAAVLLAVGFGFWEFFTPYNLFGEPLVLVGVELALWSIVAAAESLAIAFVVESGRPEVVR